MVGIWYVYGYQRAEVLMALKYARVIIAGMRSRNTSETTVMTHWPSKRSTFLTSFNI